ncbi:MAG: anthrone oxygenase family protein [Pseudomonadota bacterium]
MTLFDRAVATLAILFTGAIFGFFYSWACSAMWGFDIADPRVAIAAMQAVNASVRNAAFFPAFFLTPVILAWAGWQLRGRGGAWFGAAALVYLFGGLVLTMMANVPMNEALGRLAVPQDRAAAAAIWADYSGPWQAWNLARTVLSGVALALASWGLLSAGRATV